MVEGGGRYFTIKRPNKTSDLYFCVVFSGGGGGKKLDTFLVAINGIFRA